MDLARALAQRLGHPLVLENTDFGNGLDALSAQRFDAVLAGIPFSQDLLVVAYLSEPYFDAGPVLLVRAGSPPTSGRMVLAEVGTPWVDEVTHLARVGSRVEWFWELEDGVQQLANENADALLVDRPTALEQLKRFPWLDMEVPPAIDEDRALYGLRVALGKRNRPLVFATNHALDEMSRDGTLRRIESDWFGASQSAN